MKIKFSAVTFSTIFGAFLLALLNLSLFSLLNSCNAIFYNKNIYKKSKREWGTIILRERMEKEKKHTKPYGVLCEYKSI